MLKSYAQLSEEALLASACLLEEENTQVEKREVVVDVVVGEPLVAQLGAHDAGLEQLHLGAQPDVVVGVHADALRVIHPERDVEIFEQLVAERIEGAEGPGLWIRG